MNGLRVVCVFVSGRTGFIYFTDVNFDFQNMVWAAMFSILYVLSSTNIDLIVNEHRVFQKKSTIKKKAHSITTTQ